MVIDSSLQSLCIFSTGLGVTDQCYGLGLTDRGLSYPRLPRRQLLSRQVPDPIEVIQVLTASIL